MHIGRTIPVGEAMVRGRWCSTPAPVRSLTRPCGESQHGRSGEQGTGGGEVVVYVEGLVSVCQVDDRGDSRPGPRSYFLFPQRGVVCCAGGGPTSAQRAPPSHCRWRLCLGLVLSVSATTMVLAAVVDGALVRGGREQRTTRRTRGLGTALPCTDTDARGAQGESVSAGGDGAAKPRTRLPRAFRTAEERARFQHLKDAYGEEWVKDALVATQSQQKFDISLKDLRQRAPGAPAPPARIPRILAPIAEVQRRSQRPSVAPRGPTEVRVESRRTHGALLRRALSPEAAAVLEDALDAEATPRLDRCGSHTPSALDTGEDWGHLRGKRAGFVGDETPQARRVSSAVASRRDRADTSRSPSSVKRGGGWVKRRSAENEPLPFTHEQYMQLVSAFCAIDYSKSGTLDWGEFCGVAFEAFGIEDFAYAEFKKLMSRNHGTVGFAECLKLFYPQVGLPRVRALIKQWGGPHDMRDGYGGYWRDILSPEDQQDITAMYSLFTQDNTLPLTLATLRTAVPLVQLDDLADVFAMHDVDGDGVLSLDEFAELMNVIFARKSGKPSIRLFFQPDELMRDM